MLHYKHKQHRHERSHKFFQWSAKSIFCLAIQAADDTMQMGVHTSFPLFTSQRKWPMLRQQSQKCASLAARCNQQSLSRCITCHWCLQEPHATKRLLPQLDVKLCCHVTVTQWRPILELSAPKFRNLLCRYCSGHEWTVSSNSHDTTTVNPALAQCECHIGK